MLWREAEYHPVAPHIAGETLADDLLDCVVNLLLRKSVVQEHGSEFIEDASGG
jgi:hypothetical protein